MCEYCSKGPHNATLANQNVAFYDRVMTVIGILDAVCSNNATPAIL
jgi:hypothetical protein